jgi:hypothetical protein
MSMRVKKTEIFLVNLDSRLPFRYGIAVMKGLPHCVVRVDLEDENGTQAGVAADNLAPKWFTKNPETTFRHDASEMIKVIEHACQAAEEAGKQETIFALWKKIDEAQRAWAERENIPPLLANFGTSMAERGIIDAFLRSRKVTLAEAIRENLFGLDLGYFHWQLRSTKPSDFLSTEPNREVFLRHTLGLSDPLTEADRTDDPRVDDGLPVSLQACIEAFGLRYFKLKIQGKFEIDFERLRAAAAVIRAHAPADYAFTLDGNEQYKNYGDLQKLFEAMAKDKDLAEFLNHLIFVEQPIYRSMALNDEAGRGLREWAGHPEVIIDESDGHADDFRRALDLGYGGTSHKNCKGIFKGVAHACLVKQLQRQNPGRKYFLSGEDLTTIGPISVVQDLSVMAHLGVTHIERNGHHYFKGLAFLPAELQEKVLKEHGDLFYRHPRGYVTLRVEQGKIRLGSLMNRSLGLEADLGTGWLKPRSDWQFDSKWD